MSAPSASSVPTKEVARLVKKLRSIGEAMQRLDLVLMSGHSQDDAMLIKYRTGEVVGQILHQGVWMGGDPIYRRIGITDYCEVSASAEAHIRERLQE